MLESVPDELKRLPQWCCAGADKIPRDPKNLRYAEVDNPATWGTFEQCIATGAPYLGLVLSENDPYVCLDLDNKLPDPAHPKRTPATEEELAIFQRLIAMMDSYTEISMSGRGYHIFVKARLEQSRQRGHVELYGSRRFIVITGNKIAGNGIEDRQALIDMVAAEMRTPTSGTELDETIEEDLTDAELFDMAINATNGDKFNRLMNGQIEGYSSDGTQSEADFALLSILCFYSKCNEQVRRLFRLSDLGKREKATRNDKYLNTAIKKIRSQEPPPVQIMFDIAAVAGKPKPPTPPTIPDMPKPSVEFPRAPGFLGQLTDQMLTLSARPVYEISLIAAIGLMAGICGRAFNVSRCGLNQYLVLFGKTGVGKDAIADNIDCVMAQLAEVAPGVTQFVGPGAFASGQGLVRAFDNRKSFVSVLGEIGKTFQDWSNPNIAGSNMIRKTLLHMYGRSGKGKILSKTVYSDSDKNTASVDSPAFSFIGETAPDPFFEALNESHIVEGLLPRFLCINYDGGRMPLNKNPATRIDEGILRHLQAVAGFAMSLDGRDEVQNVTFTAEAERIVDAFGVACDKKINDASNGNASVEIWNRAHMKVLRLAALAAACDNPCQPQITKEHADWAINIVTRDSNMMSERFESGDFGGGDAKQLNDVRRSFDAFDSIERDKLQHAYSVPREIMDMGLVPYVYLQRRTASLSAFRKDKRGSTGALLGALQTLVATGEIVEVPQSQYASFGYSGKCYKKK